MKVHWVSGAHVLVANVGQESHFWHDKFCYEQTWAMGKEELKKYDFMV